MNTFLILDFSSSVLGLFGGLAVLLAVIIACGIHSVAYDDNKHTAWLVFASVELAIFCVGLLACLFGFYR